MINLITNLFNAQGTIITIFRETFEAFNITKADDLNNLNEDELNALGANLIIDYNDAIGTSDNSFDQWYWETYLAPIDNQYIKALTHLGT